MDYTGTPTLNDSLSNILNTRPASTAGHTPNRHASLHYQRAQIETASPIRLIVLLYEGAIRFCGQAVEAIQKRNLEEQNTNLIKAQRIVSELLSSLNRTEGGEVADNLARLYVYMFEELVNANLNDKAESIINVQKMLIDLRDTWIEVDKLAARETHVEQTTKSVGDCRA